MSRNTLSAAVFNTNVMWHVGHSVFKIAKKVYINVSPVLFNRFEFANFIAQLTPATLEYLQSVQLPLSILQKTTCFYQAKWSHFNTSVDPNVNKNKFHPNQTIFRPISLCTNSLYINSGIDWKRTLKNKTNWMMNRQTVWRLSHAHGNRAGWMSKVGCEL